MAPVQFYAGYTKPLTRIGPQRLSCMVRQDVNRHLTVNALRVP